MIAVREAVRVARRAGRIRADAAAVEELRAPGDPQLAVDITDVLARLSPEHRAVLVLRDVEGLDERQASQVLVQRGTVRSRLFRARTSFRKAWTHD